MALGTRRRSRRSSIDIWPGFVDALAQLLMVIIFVLLVFTAGQFLLSDALSGRDKALAQLQQQVNELSDLLAVEKRSGAELREGAASLILQAVRKSCLRKGGITDAGRARPAIPARTEVAGPGAWRGPARQCGR